MNNTGNKMNIDLAALFSTKVLPLISQAAGLAMLFLAPVQPVMIAVGFLVLVDLCSGLYAAHKRGEKLSSNGIRRTVTKSLAYMAAIICSHIMDVYFLQGIVEAVKIVAGLIAITEFQSLMENLSSIMGIDVWQEVLKKLQGTKIVPELRPAISNAIVEKVEETMAAQPQPVQQEQLAEAIVQQDIKNDEKFVASIPNQEIIDKTKDVLKIEVTPPPAPAKKKAKKAKKKNVKGFAKRKK